MNIEMSLKAVIPETELGCPKQITSRKIIFYSNDLAHGATLTIVNPSWTGFCN